MMENLLKWFRSRGDRQRSGDPGLQDALPWYINRTLGEAERRAVEDRLEADPQLQVDLAEWQRLHRLVSDQHQRLPPPQMRAEIMNRISTPPSRSPVWKPSTLFGALAFSLVALLVLWITIRPGVQLEWSVEGSGLAAYRVYRTEEGSAEFQLLEEIPAETGASNYRYIDTLLLPGERYVYLVQGLQEEGATAFSQAVTGGSQEALPGQAAVLLVSLFFGLGGAWIWQSFSREGSSNRRLVG